ncbi:MAG: 3-dehydroquinate synthase [Calditrichaeota bacterium]|nr:3-dehydroquinate synthase [Calditrichota bacterium]
MDSFSLRSASGEVPTQYARDGVRWIASELAGLFGASHPRVLIVTDENVALHYLSELREELAAFSFECHSVVIPPGEAQKTIERVRQCLDVLAMKRFARDDMVLALGGGVVTDLAGFVAGLYMRGIRWVAVPTSLLGMVDAAIGGKTGVNHALGKNLIGVFHQPLGVLGALDTLATLPERELRSGAAEIVKCALLAGGDFWSQLETAGPDALKWSQEQLDRFVALSAKTKIDIVSRDELESGERVLLNLGHTFGHALEQVTGYVELTHGEAVFYGLRAAIWLSFYSETIHPKRADDLLGWLSGFTLPAVTCDGPALLTALQADKKTRSRKLNWILLQDAGAPIVTANVGETTVRECAEWLAGIARKGNSSKTSSPRRPRILILNGPNLNLLGSREPDIYGQESYDDLVALCRETAAELQLEILVRQSNSEGEFVELVQWARHWADGLVLNPGGYTHTSVAIRDALAAVNLPAVEVHLSDPQAREPFRHVSLISELCLATVKGERLEGYRQALQKLANLSLETPTDGIR